MPAGATYEPIATVSTTAGQASVTFNSFSGYTDLRIVMNYRSNTGIAGSSIQFNGDTGTNYSETYITGNGTTASSARYTNANYIQVGWQGWATTTIPNLNIVDIFNYSGSTNKTVLVTESADRNGAGSVTRAVALWRNTAAITSITINENAGGGNYAAGSTFTLYGIKAA